MTSISSLNKIMTVVCAATALSTGGLMAADLPPSGYQLLDFIESTGVQTIETGVVFFLRNRDEQLRNEANYFHPRPARTA